MTDQRTEMVIQMFSRIYIGGIPPTITDESAYLSFISTLSAIEALGTYRAPSEGNGPRFRGFIGEYFAEEYKPLASDLWNFRNGIVHAFNPGRFVLTH